METDTMSTLAYQREVLGHSGLGFTEVRIISKGVREFVDNDEALEASCMLHADTDNYISINPRYEKRGTNDAVKYLTCLVVDIDPIRAKDTASTDEQHDLAISVGQSIATAFPGTILVDSGSGCHVYFPVKPLAVTNAKALYASVKKWADGIRSKYAVAGVNIDSIYDLARLIRVWGSHNYKSNRPCVVLSNPFELKRFEFSFSQDDLTEKPSAPVSATEERFLRVCVTNPIISRIVSGESQFDNDRSASDFSFFAELTKAQFSPDEIWDLRHRNPSGRKGEVKRADVDRVAQKIRDEEMPVTSLIGDSDKYIRGLKNRTMGLKTGFPSFDEMVSGLKPQKVIVLAARPTEGKTTLAVQITRTLAEQGEMCLFFPTEVGAEPIYDKIVSAKTNINLKAFQNGGFTDAQMKDIVECKSYLAKLPFAVVEDFGLTVDRIEAHVAKVRPRVFVVDYIQALCYENGGEPREIAGAMRKIKEIAGDYNATAIVCSQLLRESDNKSPFSLSRLKGSGAIEEFGDVIAFMYTPVEEKFTYPRPVEFVVTKSKYSAIGNVPLKFWTSTCKLEEAI